MTGRRPVLIVAAALLVFTAAWNSGGLHAAGSGKTGQTVRKTTPHREKPGHVQPVKAVRMSVKPGDLVSLRVTLRLKDGALVFTTEPGIADKERRAAGYLEPDCHIPLTMLCGDAGPVPGLKEVLAGMHAGERKTIILPPEKAFGRKDVTKIRAYDRIRKLDRVQRMKPSDFTLMTGQEPVTGKEFNINPYFPSKVVTVTDQEVVLENLARDVSDEQGPMGSTSVRVKGDRIEIIMTPLIGSDFEVIGMKGKISSYDAATFSVDFNTPLAGREIVLTAEVVSLTPRAGLEAETLPWIEDYRKGLAAAKKAGKPSVVVLYASWCQWSRKYNEEVLEDPRIKALKDRFVWIREDSDRNRELARKYGQDTFPLTVVLNPDGTLRARLGGYTEAQRLSQQLGCVLSGQKVKPEAVLPAGIAPAGNQGCPKEADPGPGN